MKNLFYLIPLMFLGIACNDEDVTIEDLSESKKEMIVKRSCSTEENLQRQLAADPSLALRMELLESSQSKAPTNTGDKLAIKKIRIPIVINVLYRMDSENISDAQIQSQIDVFNRDFNGLNSSYFEVPQVFNHLKANVGIEFYIDKIERKYVNVYSWVNNDLMKGASGLYPTEPETKLNIWICTLYSAVMGYAQYPGGNASTDGIVINSKYFGTLGTVKEPYNLGRTSVHEMGHWLNLRHIWGDSTCGDDGVADTPQHNSANYGIPTFPHLSTCEGTPIEMTMNYMDYVSDVAMSMFTLGQKERMLATLQAGGPRAAYVR